MNGAGFANDIVLLTMCNEQSDYFTHGAYNRETFRCDDFPFVFHTVDACRVLHEKAGLKPIHEIAAGGYSELLKDKINEMNEAGFAQYLRFHEYICEKAEHLGASNHLLFVARKD